MYHYVLLNCSYAIADGVEVGRKPSSEIAIFMRS